MESNNYENHGAVVMTMMSIVSPLSILQTPSLFHSMRIRDKYSLCTRVLHN